ncbi:hypothetical protein N8927_03765 [Crocinitomicaceae bacterium]|nr:hypothetical protein [Crocinitomicaceae bacterium]
MITNKKYINLSKCSELHNSFVQIPTWTKEKHEKSHILNKYLQSIESISIISKRYSTAHKVDGKHMFTVCGEDSGATL